LNLLRGDFTPRFSKRYIQISPDIGCDLLKFLNGFALGANQCLPIVMKIAGKRIHSEPVLVLGSIPTFN